MVLAGEVKFQIGVDKASLDQAVNLINSRLAQVARVELNIDARQAAAAAKAAQSSLGQIKGPDTARAQANLNQLNSSLNKLSGDKASRELDRLQRELQETASAASNTSGKTSSLQSVLSGLAGGAAVALLDRLVGAFGALASSVTGFVSSSISANAQLRGTENALTAVLGSQEAAAESIQFLRDTANATGQSFSALSNNYAGLAAAANETGIPISQVNELFAETSRSLGIFGKSADQANRVFNALQQITAKGTLSMEELRQQLGEQLPVAFGATARGLGVTVEELEKLVSTGEISAAEFIPAFTAGLKEMEGGLSPVAASLAIAGNAFLELQQNIGRALEPIQVAFADTFAAILSNVDAADALEPLVSAGERLGEALEGNPEAAERLGEAFENLLGSGAEALATIIDNFSEAISDPSTIETWAAGIESLGESFEGIVDSIFQVGDALTTVIELFDKSLALGAGVQTRQEFGGRGGSPIQFDGPVSRALGIGDFAGNRGGQEVTAAAGGIVGSVASVFQDAFGAIGVTVSEAKDGSKEVAREAEAAAKAAASAKKKADEEALKKFKEGQLNAISAIEAAEQNRIANVRRQQASGAITADEADAQISQIEIDSINERIEAKKEELSQLESFKKKGVESEEEVGKARRRITEEIAKLTNDALNEEIAAQEAVAEAAKKAAEEQKKAILDQLAAQSRLNDLRAEQINIESEIGATALNDQLSLLDAQVTLEQSRLTLSGQALQGRLAELSATDSLVQAAKNSIEIEATRDRLLLNSLRSVELESKAKQDQLRISNQLSQIEDDRALALAQIAQKEAEISVSKARAEGADSAEIQALQEIVQLRGEQIGSIQAQQAQQAEIFKITSEQLGVEEEIARQAALQENKLTSATEARQLQLDLAKEQQSIEENITSEFEKRESAARGIVDSLAGLKDVTAEDAIAQLDQLEANLKAARQAGAINSTSAGELGSLINQAQQSASGGFSVEEAFRFAQRNEGSGFAEGILGQIGLGAAFGVSEAQQELLIAESQISELKDKLDEVRGAIELLPETLPPTVENLYVSSPDPVGDGAQIVFDLSKQSISEGALP